MPFQTWKLSTRLVWCLLISQVPFLYGLLDWKLVSPERRRQLRQATEKQVKLADQAYQHMQQEYKVMHQVLFRFMTTFTGVETRIARYAELVEPQLDSQSTALLADLCERGRSLFEQATTHARTMLLEQGELPVIDAVKIDADNQVIDTVSFPLLPLLPKEDRERFFALMNLLAAWQQEITAFWDEHGL